MVRNEDDSELAKRFDMVSNIDVNNDGSTRLCFFLLYKNEAKISQTRAMPSCSGNVIRSYQVVDPRYQIHPSTQSRQGSPVNQSLSPPLFLEL